MHEMTLSHPARWLGPLLLALLTACGGGGGGTTDVAGGGIGGTGISSGPITATGTVAAASLGGAVTTAAISTAATTITVNGGVFVISDMATVTLNGAAAGADALRIGQVVTVTFTGDPTAGTAIATAVTYDPNLTAPVEAVDVAGRRVMLLGQWVSVDTLLDADGEDGNDITLDELDVDDLVEISGSHDADGLLHATRIERKGQSTEPTAPVEVEVEGVVADLAADRLGFTLGTLTVVIPQGLAIDGTLAEGGDVDVEGSLSGSTLTASDIQVKSSPIEQQEVGSQVELEGFITAVDRLASHDEIEVDGVVVRLTSATEIRRDESGMATRAHLMPNVEVEVEGRADGAGAVEAEQITLDG